MIVLRERDVKGRIFEQKLFEICLALLRLRSVFPIDPIFLLDFSHSIYISLTLFLMGPINPSSIIMTVSFVTLIFTFLFTKLNTIQNIHTSLSLSFNYHLPIYYSIIWLISNRQSSVSSALLVVPRLQFPHTH